MKRTSPGRGIVSAIVRFTESEHVREKEKE